MSLNRLSLEELQASADAALEETASRLHTLLSELAARLRPFPSFLNMVSIQAIELQPPIRPAADRGCVVICPDGAICELDLQTMPALGGLTEADHLEEFRPLTLPAEEYIIYAATAIRVLTGELRRRRR